MTLKILSVLASLALGYTACTSDSFPKRFTAPIVRTFHDSTEDAPDTANAPILNRRIIRYAEANGPSIAPTYSKAVCTEFLDKVLKPFVKLKPEERRLLYVNLGKQTLEEARAANDPALAGVYAALTKNGKGTAIPTLEAALPGDLVQFWYWNKGHCGILRGYYPELGLISLYSSAGSSNGYGVQLYWIPQELYIVRLKEHSQEVAHL